MTGARSALSLSKNILSAALLTTFLGCGDAPVTKQPGSNAPPAAKSGASARRPKASASAPAASADAPASASAAVVPTIAVPIDLGPVKWSDFSGPKVKSELLANSTAWVAMPVSQGWETLKFALVTVDHVDGDDVVVVGSSKQQVFVPAAFTFPAKTAETLAKGDAVLVSAKDSRAFARVVGTEGGKVRVRYRYAGDLQEVVVAANALRKLDGALHFGAPAAFSEVGETAGGNIKTTWRPVFFVHSAEDRTWVVTSSGRPIRVPSKNVKPLDVQVIHKPGDKVWVTRGEEFKPASVSEVEDEGLRYKLRLDSGEDTSATFEGVSAAPK
ncbi:MAG: hypothetical protein U0271_02325 [Polyangiaceae bacterium]